MSELDLPTNQRHCDPGVGGCGNIFSITLTQCPNCRVFWGTEDFFTEGVENMPPLPAVGDETKQDSGGQTDHQAAENDN